LIKNFSIIIPVYNEEGNILGLINEIFYHLSNKQFNFEIIIINDSSTDNTEKILQNFSNNKSVILSNNEKNMGQSFSIFQGIKLSKYNNIVTIDGDGQNNPSDIINLLNLYFSSESIKLVGGIRNKRKDNLVKIISSK